MTTAEAHMPTETTINFTIPRSDWFGLLGDVLPFVGDDGYFPMLTVIQITIEGKRITARATDRFSLGRAWYEHEEEIGHVTALIPAAEVRAAVKLHAAHRRGLPQKDLDITLRVVGVVDNSPGSDSGTMTVISGGTFDARVTSEHKLWTGEYVDIDKLIPETGFADTGEIWWRPNLMDKVRRVRRSQSGGAVKVRFSGPSKPIRIDVGHQFTAAIMPARPEPE